MRIYEILEEQLKKEPNYITDNGELKKWVIINKAQNYDAELIKLILENKELKEKFFIVIKDEVLVFNQSLFIEFLEQKNFLNDSYTAYKNKVGLTIGGKYLKQRNEVALVWPFKDCILEGGQSREEDKREEIFFNEILAQDEITQLLEPKVLTNAKRYTTDGSKPLDNFNRNQHGIITDNLIIKGNNLLALHTLKKEFAGQVKLIYIDPPYNTGSDSFKYNDSFNHSTWLTFMKNRIAIARDLLTDDGSIWINIDDDESHYLKVLCDEIIGRDNFIANVVWQKKYAASNDAKYLSDIHDNILIYAKTKTKWKPNLLERPKELNAKYSNPDNDPRGVWYSTNLSVKTYSEKNDYIIVGPNGQKFSPPPSRCWVVSEDKYFELFNDNRIWFGKDGNSRPYQKKFLTEVQDGIVPTTFWTHSDGGHNIMAKTEIRSLFPEQSDLFPTPKPEKLIQRIITIGSNENDIVLDFFAGSGTTATVALKMKRQFITTEQMNYIEKITLARLKKVIDGEQGGISELVEWKGGGELVYLELKKYNQTFIEQIEEAKDTIALLSIWEEMKTKSFLNYNIDLQKQEEHIEEFKVLTLAEQKQHLVELLDKNQLYVNLSSLNDTDFACTDEEKKVTKEFYQLKK